MSPCARQAPARIRKIDDNRTIGMPESLQVFAAGGAVSVFTNHDREFVYKVPLAPDFDIVGRASHAWRQNIRRQINRSIRNPRLLPNFFASALPRRWAKKFYSAKTQEFTTCLDCLEFLGEVLEPGEQKFFPNTQTVDGANYKFQIGDAQVQFDGPLIKQEMVDCFSTDDKFSAADLLKIGPEIVDIQTELWRYGIGLTKSSETWGPSNWGRTTDGRICLVDLGSVSHDQAIVRRYVTKESAENRAIKLRKYGVSDDVDCYINLISAHLNPDTLERMWETKSSFREWRLANERPHLPVNVRHLP